MGRAATSAVVVTRPLRHADVARQIEKQIREGRFAPGSRITSERELSRSVGVSRVTLRKALQELRQKGLLVADQARGWFVAKASVEEKNVLRSFTELARSRGFEVHSRVLAATARVTTASEAEILRAPDGAPIFEVRRVRYMGDEPLGIETSRVPLARCPAIATADLSTSSIHDLLKQAGAAPSQADYALTALVADESQAALLGVDAGFPLLSAEAITRDEAGSVVELSTTVFRGDRYRFHTTLKAR